MEVVLAVCTFGIGAAVKGGLKAAEWLGRVASWFAKFGKIGRAMGKVANLLGKGLKWLMTTVQKFAERLMELGNKLLDKFKQIFKNLEKKIDDIVAKLSGKGDDVAEHADDGPHAHNGPDGKVKVDEDGVVDTDGIDPHDAKNKRKGNRDEDYLLAVAEAKLLIEANEALGITATIAAKDVLGALKLSYPWVSGMEARFDGPGNYDFYMSASPPKKVKNDYQLRAGFKPSSDNLTKEQWKKEYSDYRRDTRKDGRYKGMTPEEVAETEKYGKGYQDAAEKNRTLKKKRAEEANDQGLESRLDQPEPKTELSKGARDEIGNLQELQDLKAREALFERGGNKSAMQQAQDDYWELTVAEIAELSATGDREAKRIMKLIKQASKKAQKYD